MRTASRSRGARSVARIACALLLSSGLCAAAAALPRVLSASASDYDPRDWEIVFHSEAVARASNGEDPARRIVVRLPAGYDKNRQARYGVVYGFHGYGCLSEQMTYCEREIEKKLGKEIQLIFVAVDGTNALDGSFYVNSPIIGDFEDMVVKEVVPLVDSRFRTKAESSGRMLAGFSMGGFGAWNLALAHADVFGAAWACCPGAFDGDGLAEALRSWDSGTKLAYGSAFGYEYVGKDGKPLIPKADGSDPDLSAAWQKGFGDFDGKIASYREKKAELRMARFDYGEADGYAWIPRGVRTVARAFADAGIPTSIQGYPCGHDMTPEMVFQGFVPFMREFFGPVI